MSVVPISRKLSQTQQRQSLENKFVNLFTRAHQAPDLSYLARKQALKALHQGLKKHRAALEHALNQDFPHRSLKEQQQLELLPCFESLRQAKRQLKTWMHPRPHKPTRWFGKSCTHYQPLGIIGIIVPAFSPLRLAILPLISALAAGNRVMLKLDHHTPHTNSALKDLFEEYFDKNLVDILTGDRQITEDFSTLPFDHLLFIGESDIGQKVLQNTAEHLTPTTLALTGKSSVIVAPDANLDMATHKILAHKCFNAGQTELAPDQLYIPTATLEAFVQTMRSQWQQRFPKGLQESHHSQIQSQENYQHLLNCLEDAKAQGCPVISFARPANLSITKKIALHLVINPPAHCLLMKAPIQGPILPIFTYQTLDQLLNTLKVCLARLHYPFLVTIPLPNKNSFDKATLGV